MNTYFLETSLEIHINLCVIGVVLHISGRKFISNSLKILWKFPGKPRHKNSKEPTDIQSKWQRNPMEILPWCHGKKDGKSLEFYCTLYLLAWLQSIHFLQNWDEYTWIFFLFLATFHISSMYIITIEKLLNFWGIYTQFLCNLYVIFIALLSVFRVISTGFLWKFPWHIHKIGKDFLLTTVISTDDNFNRRFKVMCTALIFFFLISMEGPSRSFVRMTVLGHQSTIDPLLHINIHYGVVPVWC